jgi:hypothetical protein
VEEKRMIILPTGECFSDAVDYIECLVRANLPFHDCTIVHALCRVDGQPELGWFAHGWVERGENCIFAGVVAPDAPEHAGEKVWITAEKESFYKDLHVRCPKRYTPRELADWNQKTGNLGPWEEPYVSFTRAAKERRNQNA